MSASTQEHREMLATRQSALILSKSPSTSLLVEKYEDLVEQQRRLLNAHREIWELEQQRLKQRISILESSLQWYQLVSSSQALSVIVGITCVQGNQE